MTQTYEGLLANVLATGEDRTDRTGTGTLSLFSPPPLVYDLSRNAVPLITSKRVPWKMALAEFMWMLSGSTDTRDLAKTSQQMASIWDKWAVDGDVGPTYGAQYRNAGNTAGYGIDQLAQTIGRLIESPDTRRALISLWSVNELPAMQLEPCMVMFQFSLRGPKLNELHCHVYQRSADLMLGVPFDLFQAGLLTHLIARELCIETRKPIKAAGLTWTAGDAHIYHNQVESVTKLLAQSADAPRMRAKIELPIPHESLRLLDGSLTAGHISVTDYTAAPAISAPIAV